MESPRTAPARALFVATILAGSFLLFLVQPLVARLALPLLGGAPNVWNSAMLVYQVLLLGGYLYAHALGRLPLRRQAALHLGLLALAGLTLPLRLFPLAPPAPGGEVWWVPLLLGLTVGPVFLLVSAQAPLMQRWFAAAPGAGNPYPLYAASNLGSFAGLLAYPLLAEPLLPLRAQSWWWSAGYALLFGLVVAAARTRRHVPAEPAAGPRPTAPSAPIPARRFALWLALSAVPSGLMLSTTTHLTTDVFAMPLLWVIPLGLYLLSFTLAFSDRAWLARPFLALAPVLILLAGGLAMMPAGNATMAIAVSGVALLFVVSVTLHARLYALRPEPDRLTLFYLALAIGGMLGGLFCALIAPLVFDWSWEHPLLILAAAALIPLPRWLDWRRLPGLAPEMTALTAATLFGFGLLCAWLLLLAWVDGDGAWLIWVWAGALALCGLGLAMWRWLYLPLLVATMLALGGTYTVLDSWQGARSRSYFGIYTLRDYPEQHLRTLAHGTTLHGQQYTDARRDLPGTYYGPSSGVGIVLAHAPRLAGPAARIGVVGLGAGTLACFAKPGQHWRFFEIDPAVLAFSTSRRFTYLADCAPGAQVVLGDARLELAKVPPGSLDLLVIDAFTSDAIPLHLLTREAFGVYFRTLAPEGLLLVHISNRHVDLAPVLGAIARSQGLAAALRRDNPEDRETFTPSSWVLFARSPVALDKVRSLAPQAAWEPLPITSTHPWTDDHASVLPHVRWSSLVSR